MPQKILGCKSNIFDDLPQQKWRDIAIAVKWNTRAASVLMSELFMRSALTNFNESQLL